MTSSTTSIHSSIPYKKRSIESSAKEHHLNIGRRITPISRYSLPSTFRFMKVVTVALLACLLFPVAAALNWNCPTPPGSYLDSCERPNGVPYHSPDPYLAHIHFCSFDCYCKQVNKPDADKRFTRKIVTREDLACAKNWENCDGFLIARQGDERFCQNMARIRAELIAHGLIHEKDEL